VETIDFRKFIFCFAFVLIGTKKFLGAKQFEKKKKTKQENHFN
jgi:hypothetical protein